MLCFNNTKIGNYVEPKSDFFLENIDELIDEIYL